MCWTLRNRRRRMNFKAIKWDESGYAEYVGYLKSLADEKYREFNNKITPDSGSAIMGVRVPELRRIAKEIAMGDGRGFLDYVTYSLKDSMTQEEIIIAGLTVGAMRLPFGELCQRIRTYASMVNNWACCDVPVSSFKGIKNFIEEYKIEIYRFLKSENPWEQRVGIIILLDYYLSDEDSAAYALSQVNSVKSGEYYVNMAQAWLIATAFAKRRDLTKSWLENEFDLGESVLKMTVRKLRDSYRVSSEDKDWAAGLLK